MRLGRVLTLVLGGALLGASMQAQERGKKPSAGWPAMEMAKPAPEMEKRKWVVGRWNVTETHEKSDWSPGGIGKGTSVIALGPGGHSQIITYNSTGPTGKFSGHGIIAWDPEAKIYRSTLADSVTPGMITMDCREEGKDWVCFGESIDAGKENDDAIYRAEPRRMDGGHGDVDGRRSLHQDEDLRVQQSQVTLRTRMLKELEEYCCASSPAFRIWLAIQVAHRDLLVSAKSSN